MPSPMDTEFRVHDSPVPTQTVCGSLGSIAIAPIDCTGALSKTGRKVVPPSPDFQTPPLAAPTYRMVLPPSLRAARAAIRPLIVADPMLRDRSPEMTPESSTGAARLPGADGGAAAAVCAGAGAGMTERPTGPEGERNRSSSYTKVCSARSSVMRKLRVYPI